MADLVSGDGGSRLRATVRDSQTDELIDLTTKTVELRYSINGGAVVTKTMTAMDQVANKGKAEYQFLTTDLTEAGELKGEVRLQAGQSDQLTTVDTFHLAIKAPLA